MKQKHLWALGGFAVGTLFGAKVIGTVKRVL